MYYVGLDVHYRTSTYCILNADGREVNRETIRGHWPKLLDRLTSVMAVPNRERTKTQLARFLCVRGYLDYIEKPNEYIKNRGNSQAPPYTQERSGAPVSGDLICKGRRKKALVSAVRAAARKIALYESFFLLVLLVSGFTRERHIFSIELNIGSCSFRRGLCFFSPL